MNIYTWSVWLHVLFAFIFFFAHGTSMAVAFLLPGEKDLAHLKAYLDITGITIAPLGISLLGILVTSIYMGVAAGWAVRAGGDFHFYSSWCPSSGCLGIPVNTTVPFARRLAIFI